MPHRRKPSKKTEAHKTAKKNAPNDSLLKSNADRAFDNQIDTIQEPIKAQLMQEANTNGYTHIDEFDFVISGGDAVDVSLTTSNVRAIFKKLHEVIV